jgi:acid phosphatase type 7
MTGRRPVSTRAWVALACAPLATAIAVARCTQSPRTGPDNRIVQLLVIPASIATTEGQTVQFHAWGRTAAGDTQSVAASWSATGGTIDPTGLFVAGLSSGDFRVMATAQEGTLADTSSVTITAPATLTQLLLIPASATVTAGTSRSFTSYGRMTNGDSVAVSVTYSATGGTITAGGLYTAGQAAGDFQVIATQQGGTLADTSPVTVTLATVLASVVLVPPAVTLEVGATQQFAAHGLMSNGDSVAVTVSYAATGGTISAGGLFTAGQTAGDFRVIATEQAGTLADTSNVTVVATTTLAQVVLVPPTVSLNTGATQQFASYGRMNTGDSVAVSVSYSATGGTITAGGLYTAGQTGGGFRVIAVQQGGTLADTSGVTITASGGSVVLVGAGDIADCSSTWDEATAVLLDNIAGTVFTAGDNAYPDGTASDYANCYEPNWGRHKARTRPSPGNHDYNTAGAADYYAYFGSTAGPAGLGYYSYDLGAWHIISLNSEVDMSAGSVEETWLRADLAASSKQCTLAYWHKPRFSSGTKHGSMVEAQPLWQALYDYHAELVINGHEHNYERFAPQTPTGSADSTNGIREIVAGTGGKDNDNDLGTVLPNSELFNGLTSGVLKLTLGPGTYTWEFIPIAGLTFTDSGSGTCH